MNFQSRQIFFYSVIKVWNLAIFWVRNTKFGLFLTKLVILKNRNIFKNGENLELSATGSIGKSGNVTISQINYDLILKIPKFIFLGEKVNNSTNLLNPRSYVNFGSSNQRNIGLDRNSLKFDFNYSWNKNDNFFKQFLPP